MNASVETRYPFLDDDVIAFCAGIAPEYKLRGRTEKWILRQVAARILPAADRQPAQDDVPRRACRGRSWARTGRPGSTSSSAPSRCARPAISTPRPWPASGPGRSAMPRITPRRFVFDVGLTCVVSTQLWHHLFCGGGLCDLPTWQPPTRRLAENLAGA